MTFAEAQQRKLLKQIALGIIDTVRESMPDGCPGGVLFMGLTNYGFNLTQFEGIMQGLVDAGRLVKRGDLYYTE